MVLSPLAQPYSLCARWRNWEPPSKVPWVEILSKVGSGGPTMVGVKFPLSITAMNPLFSEIRCETQMGVLRPKSTATDAPPTGRTGS
jgi:hypothetical protein